MGFDGSELLDVGQRPPNGLVKPLQGLMGATGRARVSLAAGELALGTELEGLGGLGALGNGPSADRARRAFERMCGLDPVLAACRRLHARQIAWRLRSEEAEDLPLQGLIVHREA